MIKKLILVFLFLLPAAAAQGQMKLLAVQEDGTNFTGSTADLYLDVQKGTGRVYLETFPLTKLDTQLSTRFAKDIACSYLDVDCSKYDFFYSIRAGSSIIGGPSAGAAIAILTASELSNKEIDEKVTITGTINSGGFIGPVGGVEEKLKAAKQAGLTKVLIPIGNDNITNITGIEIVEVSSLRQAVSEFTQEPYETLDQPVTLDKSYEAVMKELADMLCERAEYLSKQVPASNATRPAENLTQQGSIALDGSRTYSAASFCFGASIDYRELLLKNATQEEINNTKKDVLAQIKTFNIPPEINTITDLQTYMVVKNRLADAERAVNDTNNTDTVAYAVERLYSARSWSKFFGKGGREIELNQETLKQGCLDKISEAEERNQYSSLYFPAEAETLKEQIQEAKDYLDKEDYAMCMFEASKAKASSNIILSLLGVEEDGLKGVVLLKLDILRDNLNRNIEPGMFPILGYSYYDYANSLVETNPSSAILYAEYALELSNLDIYFQERSYNEFEIRRLQYVNYKVLAAFLIGLLIGIAIASMQSNQRKRPRKTPVFGKKR